MLEELIDLLNKWAVKENDGIDAEGIAKFLLENNVIKLPVAIGVSVWVLGQPCGGCQYFNEPMQEDFIKECQQCKKWEVEQCCFDYDLIPEFGKLVFFTKEEAEKALAEKLA